MTPMTRLIIKTGTPARSRNDARALQKLRTDSAHFQNHFTKRGSSGVYLSLSHYLFCSNSSERERKRETESRFYICIARAISCRSARNPHRHRSYATILSHIGFYVFVRARLGQSFARARMNNSFAREIDYEIIRRFNRDIYFTRFLYRFFFQILYS